MPRSIKSTVSHSAKSAMPERLLTTDETAEFLGVPKQTLSNWRCENRGPAYDRVGKYVRYRMSEVMDWLNAQRAEHLAGARDGRG
jgi:excisionase family DNA binding protein